MREEGDHGTFIGTASASAKVEQGEPRDAATKRARQRMSVLELAAELGNAAAACRQRGMDRTSFYEWKRRFQTPGFAGLKDLPPIHRSHPQTTLAETVRGSRSWRWHILPSSRSNSPRSRLPSWKSSIPAFASVTSRASHRRSALRPFEHRKTKVRTPRTNDFVERFNGTVLNEFFHVKTRETFYDAADALQADVDAWLVHYNADRLPSAIATRVGGQSKPSSSLSIKKVKRTYAPMPHHANAVICGHRQADVTGRRTSNLTRCPP